jgi:Spy/CpxP family protein refolding chaperone
MGGPGGKGMKGFGRLMPEAGLYPPPMVLHHAHALGLSDAQVAKIKQDMFDTRAKVIDAGARSKKARLEVMRLLSAPKADQQAVNRRIDEAAAAEAESHKVRLGLLLRTRDALTQEQRTKLDQALKEHGGMHGGMGGPRAREWEKGSEHEHGPGPHSM